MAPKTYPRDSGTRFFPRLPSQVAPFVTRVLAPLLIVLSILAGVFALPPLFGEHNGHALAVRFLPQADATSPDAALLQLAQRPTRLAARLPEGITWLLADLPTTIPDTTAPQALLLPTHALRQTTCWLMERTDPLGGDGEQYAPRLLATHATVMGAEMPLPAQTTAQQAACRVDLATPDTISIQHWDQAALLGAATREARAIGLGQGGLLTLALFLVVIALTMREWPYVLLSCWLVGNLRLGAWALGWDYQWLGFLIDPDLLPWVRKITLALYYLVTYHLFAGLFHDSLDHSTRRRVQLVGNYSALLLLVATLALPHAWFQPIVFLAAWLGTGLVAILLIHALLRSHTRVNLWHTIGVCVAISVLLTGLILVGLQRRDLINAQVGTVSLLLCSVLIALAVADQMREGRQVRSRKRNELIARDDLTPLGLFTLGATRHFEHMNPNTRAMLAITQDTDPLTHAWIDFFPAMDWLEISLATEQGRDTEIQTCVAGAGNAAKRFLLRATMAGSRIEGSLQDVGARDKSIRNLRLSDDNDPLTDTLSRRGIEAATQAAIDELQQSDAPTAMAFLDLDHLKRVNDLFGHSAGDTLLQTICERIKYALDEHQSMGRVGNEEFIILFPKMRAADARKIGQDIVESLNSAPVYVGERSFQLKTAMGIIDLDRGMRPKDAIAAASRACRDARKQHHDIVLYEKDAPELSEHFNEQHLFEQLDKEQPPEDFYLEMQPIMSLRHPLKTRNFEVLLRTRGVGGRPMRTDRIIEAAEDNGIITSIDKWVFATVLEWMSKHQPRLARTQLINVNLSGVSLNDDRFIDTLFTLLNHQPQFSRSLCIEITEGVALQDLERTRQFMRRLQRMGTRVALDDFGAGYTSFSYLKELPADMIKIDGSLIRDMLASDTNIAIVSSIVDLAHNLGMECIAEWAEDIATLRTLVDIGVDHVQGHVISTARAPAEMLAYDNILPLVTDPAVRSYIEELSGKRAA